MVTKEIRLLREKLHKAINSKGINDKTVLEISKELDQHIAQYIKLEALKKL